MVKILQPIQGTFLDYPDNESYAVIICFMGCDNGCPYCQNPEFQNPNYNNQTKEYTVDDLVKELKIQCERNRTNKIVFSGGDSLSCYNIEFTKSLLEKIKDEYDVCIYTGHNVDYAKNHQIKGFKFLKCGYFDNNKKRKSFKNDNCIQFASPNQILYNGEYEQLSENGIYYF